MKCVCIFFLLFFQVLVVNAVTQVIGASFFGTYASDQVNAAIYNPTATLFVLAGETNAANFTETPNSIIGQNLQGSNAFLSIVRVSDNMLEFSTMLGGKGNDRIDAIAWENDVIYFVGTTASGDLITSTSGTVLSVNGSTDCFLGYFNTSTYALEKLGYLGGSNTENAYGIAEDKVDGSVFVVGRTNSPNFPTFQAEFPAKSNGTSYDWFIASFSPKFVQFKFSTYLGGSGAENDVSCSLYYPIMDNGVPLVPATILFIGGNTLSTKLPLINQLRNYTGSIYQEIYCAAFNISTGTELWSTYYGGTLIDTIVKIEADSVHKALLFAGFSTSTGIATPNALFPSLIGARDMIIGSFNFTNINSVTLNYVTYFGTAGNDDCYDIVVDAHDHIFITGTAAFPNYTQVNPMFSDGRRSFLLVLDFNGNLTWSSGIAADSVGLRRIAQTQNETLLAGSGTPNVTVPQVNPISSYVGGGDAYFVRLQIDELQFNYGSMTTSKVTTGDMTTSEMTTSPITSGVVTTSPISLTSSLVTSGSLTSSPITSASVTSSVITTAAVTTFEDIITTNKAAPITSYEVTSSPMTSSKVTTSSPQLLTTALEDQSNSVKSESTKTLFIVVGGVVVVIVLVAVGLVVWSRRSQVAFNHKRLEE